MRSQVNPTAQAQKRFDIARDPAFAAMFKTMTVRTHAPGNEIYFEGDASRGVYFLESGLIGVRKTNADGDSVLLHLIFPGQPFGYESLLLDRDHGNSAECIKTARVGFVDRTTFEKFLQSRPDFTFKLLKLTVNQLNESDEKIFKSQTLPVRARLAHFLWELMEQLTPVEGRDDSVVELPVNRRYLADLIGVRPETVSRTIREIEEAGIAHFAKQMVRVPSRENLMQEIGAVAA